MRFLSKRRAALLCAGLGTVGAASAFTFGATSAQYSSLADAQNNSIQSGTITLGSDGNAQSFHFSNLMPGDTHNGAGTYHLTYSGSSPAFVGLDFSVSSQASQACPYYVTNGDVTDADPATVVGNCDSGTGTLPLFDGTTGAGNFDLSVLPENGNTAHQLLSSTATIVNDGHPTCSTVAGVVSCKAEIDNIMVPKGYIDNDPTHFAAMQWLTGQTDFIRTDVALPLAAGNEFQGGTAAIVLQSHAVQWNNNLGSKVAGQPNAGTCDAATYLASVPTITGPNSWCPVSWS